MIMCDDRIFSCILKSANTNLNFPRHEGKMPALLFVDDLQQFSSSIMIQCVIMILLLWISSWVSKAVAMTLVINCSTLICMFLSFLVSAYNNDFIRVSLPYLFHYQSHPGLVFFTNDWGCQTFEIADLVSNIAEESHLWEEMSSNSWKENTISQ